MVEQLDAKSRVWQPATADQVRQRILEITEMADRDALDMLRSRKVKQEVLDALDEPTYGGQARNPVKSGLLTQD